MMVYEKSTLGCNEFVNEKRTLHFRERQVLLLVNGIRNIDDLEKFFKKELLSEAIRKLELGGYIQQSRGAQAEKKSSVTTLSFFNADNTATPINPAKIAIIKTILVEATNDYLGLMGRNLKDRIAACTNELDLRNCISSWHMAMRESKLGRESTSFLMEQIHQTLENKMLDTSTNTH
jgi:hypothetical protein